MELAIQIAKHFKEVHFGGNWTSSNLNEQLSGISWQEATQQVHGLNTIATLVYHINYYVSEVLKVLKGEPLVARDADSFNHPPIQSKEDWEQMKNKALNEAEEFARLLEALPEHKFGEWFSEEKYGTYYRNIHGIIEHTHYHLGQIALIKKIIKK